MARVFISYSHDSEEHRERVLALARRLLSAGHEVVLDRFTAHPEPNWPQWMAKELFAADVVLCICTPTYRGRFEGTAASGGLGVAWEGHLITTELYARKGRAGWVIPVDAGEPDAVPAALRGQSPLALDDFAGIVAALGGELTESSRSWGARLWARLMGDPTGRTVSPHPPPEVHAGWAEAMSVGALVEPIWKPLRAPMGGEGYPPTQLLRAEHAVVPFLGRQELIDDLDQWCQGGGARVRLVHGPGGTGKTRLALEIGARRCREGWRAGPLAVWKDAHAPIEYLDALFRDKIPLFLIIDYADTRSEVLVPLLQRLARVEEASARVLLIARAKGDWWRRAMAEVPELDRMSFGWADVQVDGVEAGAEHAAKAAAVFAEWLGKRNPGSVRDYGRTVLDRQVEALVAVLGPGPTEGLGQLLRHEDRFLMEAGRLAGVPDAVGRVLPKVLALYTLGGGVGLTEALKWIEDVDGLADLRSAEAKAVVDLLSALYPRDGGGGVDGMRPDRVGEALVQREDADGKLAQIAVDRGRAKAALTVLTRLGANGEEGPLRRLIDVRREVLVEAVIAVAQETGDPVGRVLSESLQGRPDPAMAARIGELLPQRSLALRELAAVVADDTAIRDVSEGIRADRLISSSCRLSDLGYHEASLARAVEAVTLCRRLIHSPSAASPQSLPIALDNVATQLWHLGRAEEALDAVTEAERILKPLAALQTVEFGPDLAKVLHNKACILAALHRDSDALQASQDAVALRQWLAHAESKAFVPDLANSLGSLSNRLARCGRHEEALAAIEKAATYLRALAVEQPDAFLPDLATLLTNLSLRLAAVGQIEEAIDVSHDAVEAHRRLDAIRPEVFRPTLATSLIALSQILSDGGRVSDALGPIEEAVALQRRLAQARPRKFLPELGASLRRLAVILTYVRRHEEALSVTVDALDVYRGLAATDPDEFLPHLALSLVNLSNRLRDVGRRGDSILAGQEALTIRRGLAAVQSDEFLPAVALSLHNLAFGYAELGRGTEALRAIEEAVAIRRPLAAAQSKTYVPELSRSLFVQAQIALGSGMAEAATRAASESAAILIPHAARDPDAYRTQLEEVQRVYRAACSAARIKPDPELLK